MKPLVYLIDKKNNNNEILIDKDEFKEMLNEVYQAGFYDGQSYKGNVLSSVTSYVNQCDGVCKKDHASIDSNSDGVTRKIDATDSNVNL